MHIRAGLSEDHRYFFLDDELDEPNATAATRTIIFDLEDLDDPVFANMYICWLTPRPEIIINT